MIKPDASAATTRSVIRLAPPGAGLPGPELLIARVLFRLHRATSDRKSAAAQIAEEAAALAAIARACPPEPAARRVLIKRLPGLEDSSRDWSVFMTLEHLRIVNASIASVIAQLARDRVPSEVASTATVKPAPGIGPEVVAAFQTGCEELIQVAAGIPDLRTRARYAHPWFGPLDAAGWHAMAGWHMRLHHRQIDRIVKGLNSE